MPWCIGCGTETGSRYCPNCGIEIGGGGGGGGSQVATAAAAAAGVSAAPPPVQQRPQVVPQGWVAPAATPVSGMGTTEKGKYTANAHAMLGTTGERLAWEGAPSWKCLAPRMVVFGGIMLLALAWSGFGLAVVVLFFSAINLGIAYWGVRNTNYKLTSQRLEVKRGWLTQTTNTFNLVDINQVRIVRPFPISLLGLGNMELDVVDPESRANAPKALELRGLVEPEVLRDLIHSSSNLLGQTWDERRFGS